MTKYRLSADPDTGKPCMVSDPNGIYYSTGEVDRAVSERIRTAEIGLMSLKFALGSRTRRLEQSNDLIRRMYDAINNVWEDVRYNTNIRQVMVEADDLLLITKEAQEDAAGTHDAGTVSEGAGTGAGDSCHRDEESASE